MKALKEWYKREISTFTLDNILTVMYTAFSVLVALTAIMHASMKGAGA